MAEERAERKEVPEEAKEAKGGRWENMAQGGASTEQPRSAAACSGSDKADRVYRHFTLLHTWPGKRCGCSQAPLVPLRANAPARRFCQRRTATLDTPDCPPAT